MILHLARLALFIIKNKNHGLIGIITSDPRIQYIESQTSGYGEASLERCNPQDFLPPSYFAVFLW